MKVLSLLFVQLFFFVTSYAGTPNEISNPKVKWKFKTQGPVRSSAVLAGEFLYFGSADGYLYALNKHDGRLKWKFKTDGSIAGSPAVAGDKIVVSSRDNFVYAVSSSTGEMIWKFQMQPILTAYTEWEYFTAAPVVEGNTVLAGSGDGNLYALNLSDGKFLWKYQTGGRIRATPLVHNGVIFQPGNDGFVYAISFTDGKFLWRFRTKGADFDKSAGFDRTCIFTKPSIKDNILVFGSRDGNTYAVDINTHKQKWSFTHGPTWAMSTSIADETVFVGWSTNKLISAVDFKTGKEKWKYQAGSVTYTTGVVRGDHVLFGCADGNLYGLDKENGKKVWQFTTGSEIFSSVVYDENTIYFGCDDGFLYALEEASESHAVVYQPIKKGTAYPVLNTEIAPYLEDKGFKVLDSAQLYRFIETRIADHAPSVIVFAYDAIPLNIIGENPAQGMVRKYLDAGGKVIWFGGVPNLFSFDSKGKFIGGRDISIASRMLDVSFISPEESGNYYSRATQEGLNIGFPEWFKSTYANVAPDNVVPLAYDEYNRVSAWLKKFSDRPGSGFISFRTWAWEVPIKEKDLELIHRVALYGLR